jgi:hypothetical protein
MNFHSETIHAGQLAVFEESSGAIERISDQASASAGSGQVLGPYERRGPRAG